MVLGKLASMQIASKEACCREGQPIINHYRHHDYCHHHNQLLIIAVMLIVIIIIIITFVGDSLYFVHITNQAYMNVSYKFPQIVVPKAICPPV